MAKTKNKCKGLTPEEFCPIRHTLKVLGKRWTILIVKEIYYSRWRRLGFMDLRKRLVNASAKVLSERLKEMVKEGLVKRRVDASTTPPRVYYTLTEKGRDACKIIQDLKRYGLKWGGGNFNCENIDCELCERNKKLE
ncbi:MAG: helix-turn-helix transcriptional regulator [Candidatus Altiarchaeales archaeon]|nr:helix-turn-helix transcriptional regulator [Candidatus Altiarchaeales archaeon]